MDHAFCTDDGEAYEARQFARLDPEELAEKRNALLCPECRQRAFFRAASIDGRAPCFGARPHLPDCELAAIDAGVWGVDGQNLEDQRWNNGEIILDLEQGTSARDVTQIAGATGRARGRGRRFEGGDGDANNRQYKRLRPLLKLLLNVPAFSASQQAVRIPGVGREVISRFFVNVNTFADGHLDVFHGFWGSVTSARWYGEDMTLWINTGNRNSLSFCISEATADHWLESIGIGPDLEGLAGAQILVLGRARRSQTGKLYCPISNLAFLATILA